VLKRELLGPLFLTAYPDIVCEQRVELFWINKSWYFSNLLVSWIYRTGKFEPKKRHTPEKCAISALLEQEANGATFAENGCSRHKKPLASRV